MSCQKGIRPQYQQTSPHSRFQNVSLKSCLASSTTQSSLSTVSWHGHTKSTSEVFDQDWIPTRSAYHVSSVDMSDQVKVKIQQVFCSKL